MIVGCQKATSASAGVAGGKGEVIAKPAGGSAMGAKKSKRRPKAGAADECGVPENHFRFGGRSRGVGRGRRGAGGRLCGGR